MKSIQVVLMVIFICCSTQTNEENQDSKISTTDALRATVTPEKKTLIADSAFVYEYFLNYDPATGEYGDVDEPTVSDYWNQKNNEAIRLFKLAVKIASIPPYQRMIFANYLLKIGEKHHVTDILKTVNTRSDSSDTFYIMDSYGIPFKEFGLSKETVKKYCPDIKYD